LSTNSTTAILSEKRSQLLLFASGGGGGSAREVSFSRVAKLATRPMRIRSVPRLRVQLLIDRFSTEDGRLPLPPSHHQQRERSPGEVGNGVKDVAHFRH
jgi:hypothetical protein